jgi:putative ABC transport system ATP-binding protein
MVGRDVESIMSSPAIALAHVDLSLGRGAARVHILKDITLNVGRGETVGLTGPSGSGKSTLLMAMAGLERAKRIGIVFQSFHLIPTMTALENVAVPLELAGHRDPFRRARAELEAVGLGQRARHYPAQLSGGEQQRVALARALAPEPAILVADEPTGNLDEATGSSIVDLMFALKRDRGATLVLVTHDQGLAARCDRTVRLRSGRLESDGALEAIGHPAETGR